MLREGFIKGYFAGITLSAAIMLVVNKIQLNNTFLGIFLGTVITIFITGLLNVAKEEDYICLTREELYDLISNKLLTQEEVDNLVNKLTE